MTDLKDATGVEYRLAWRWLLPSRPYSNLQIRGLPEAVESLLRTYLGANLGAPGSGRLTVVDARAVRPTAGSIEESECICTVGPRSAVERWIRALPRGMVIRRYALLPPGRPRVVVPLATKQQMVDALQLHRPGRLGARVAVRMARLLAAVGIRWPLSRELLCIAQRRADAPPIGAVRAKIHERVGGASTDYALYLGTDDEVRKTVVLPVPAREGGVVAKVAELPSARRALCHEHAVLAALGGTTVAKWLPRTIEFDDAPEAVTLLEAYRRRRACSAPIMEDAIVEFLAALGSMSVARCSVSAYLEARGGALDRVQSHGIRETLDEAMSRNTQVVLCRSHGDFAPWNCSWTEEGLVVFDWEASRADGLALGDAFYYVAAPEVVRGRVREATISKCLSVAKAVTGRSGLDADVSLQFAIWALSVSERATVELRSVSTRGVQ